MSLPATVGTLFVHDYPPLVLITHVRADTHIEDTEWRAIVNVAYPIFVTDSGKHDGLTRLTDKYTVR